MLEKVEGNFMISDHALLFFHWEQSLIHNCTKITSRLKLFLFLFYLSREDVAEASKTSSLCRGLWDLELSGHCRKPA